MNYILNDILAELSPLDLLADQIRIEIAADEAAESWRTVRVDLGIHLREARAAFQNDDTNFGHWLVENKLEMDPHKRRSLIEMAEHPALMRRIYAETSYSKDRSILEEEFRPQAKTYGQPAIGPETEPSPTENPPASVTIVISPPKPPEQKESSKPPHKALHKGSALSAHGANGVYVYEWLRALALQRWADQPMSRVKLSRTLGTLKPETMKKVVAFIQARRADLRPHLGGDIYGASMFWEEIPSALARDISGHFVKPDAVVNKVLSDWDARVAPVMKEWIADGMPPDVRQWYSLRGRKPVPTVAPTISPELRAEAIAAGIDMADERFAVLPERTLREMIARSKPRVYESDHSGFRLAEPEPIRVFGRDIWPCPAGHNWAWRDAFYAYHLWIEADCHLRANHPRAKARGRTLMNPFAPILINIHGAAGHAFQEMVRAQFDNEDKETDTFGPPKPIIMQGE